MDADLRSRCHRAADVPSQSNSFRKAGHVIPVAKPPTSMDDFPNLFTAVINEKNITIVRLRLARMAPSVEYLHLRWCSSEPPEPLFTEKMSFPHLKAIRLYFPEGPALIVNTMTSLLAPQLRLIVCHVTDQRYNWVGVEGLVIGALARSNVKIVFTTSPWTGRGLADSLAEELLWFDRKGHPYRDMVFVFNTDEWIGPSQQKCLPPSIHDVARAAGVDLDFDGFEDSPLSWDEFILTTNPTKFPQRSQQDDSKIYVESFFPSIRLPSIFGLNPGY